jgi:glycosyltransferase involved in cell wall biosynthesis
LFFLQEAIISTTIIATVLNERAAIEALVETLVAQTHPATEIILVDGGSSDGTWQWLESARSQHPTLKAIRDESCNLKHSPGPIARGRNVAIAAATTEIIACADAGCRYEPHWLTALTGPIVSREATYALGGSCLDPTARTLWDIASAPFFGIKLNPAEPSKSCTARSMAFRKDLWQQAGGFPETTFLGEDTLFDATVRRITQPAFPTTAKALYAPRNTLGTALNQLGRYARADGALGIRPARLMRNGFRCIAEVAAVVILPLHLPVSIAPLLLVLSLELYFAFRLDARSIPWRVIPARLVFSLLVPWVISGNQLEGARNPATDLILQ